MCMCVFVCVAWSILWGQTLINTMEPLIKDSPRRGYNRNNVSTKDTFHSMVPNVIFPYCEYILKSRQTSQQRTKWLAPTCPLFRGFTVLCTCIFKCICIQVKWYWMHNYLFVYLVTNVCWSVVITYTRTDNHLHTSTCTHA